MGNYTTETFTKIYNEIEKTVEFDTGWKNGTGYLNGVAYHEFDIPNGERFIFVDDFGRRAIGIVIRKGHNLVAFERYSPTEDGERSKTIVSNTTPAIKKILSWTDGAVDGGDLALNFCDSIRMNAYGRVASVARALAEIEM